MIKRVKLETIYKMAKEDNEKIKDRKLFPDGWDEKVYDYYNKLSKESSDVEMFMEFLGGEDSPLEMAYAYRRNMYIMLYTMNTTDTIAFVDGEYDIFYMPSILHHLRRHTFYNEIPMYPYPVQSHQGFFHSPPY